MNPAVRSIARLPNGQQFLVNFHQRAEFVAALSRSDGPPRIWALYEEVRTRSSKFGWCWSTQKELARWLRVSDRTIRKLERWLQKAGLVQVYRLSLWARQLPGGTLRVLIPTGLAGGRFVLPEGILERLAAWIKTRVGSAWRALRDRISSHRKFSSAVVLKSKKTEPEGAGAPDDIFYRPPKPPRPDPDQRGAPSSGRANPKVWGDEKGQRDLRTPEQAEYDLKRARWWGEETRRRLAGEPHRECPFRNPEWL